MKKKQIRKSSTVPGERAPAAQIGHKNSENDARAQQFAASAPEEEPETPSAPAKAHPMPRNHRELGRAIIDEADPVKVGRELLDKKADRGAAARLRALETFVDWAYGKPATEGTAGGVRIIWDIPLPAHKAISSRPESSEGGKK